MDVSQTSNIRQTNVRHMADICQTGNHMDRITIRLPPQQVTMLEKLVKSGEFPTVSEAVRYAVREFLAQRAGQITSDTESISTFDTRI